MGISHCQTNPISIYCWFYTVFLYISTKYHNISPFLDDSPTTCAIRIWFHDNSYGLLPIKSPSITITFHQSPSITIIFHHISSYFTQNHSFRRTIATSRHPRRLVVSWSSGIYPCHWRPRAPRTRSSPGPSLWNACPRRPWNPPVRGYKPYTYIYR